MKRAVYENITRNFDIFEFIDEDGREHPIQHPHEGDDELSDELEFQIDHDIRMESL